MCVCVCVHPRMCTCVFVDNETDSMDEDVDDVPKDDAPLPQSTMGGRQQIL